MKIPRERILIIHIEMECQSNLIYSILELINMNEFVAVELELEKLKKFISIRILVDRSCGFANCALIERIESMPSVRFAEFRNVNAL